ncbi:hypothetical protein VNO77_23396 [Canavalia gladiata]|uniref:Uncharacterized protein n=1 Tax=Canavalia gladiata TaxID=3824 RepID=A0AAN9L7R4_CANGL
MEQLKQDITDTNKKKQLISKALTNKEKSLVDRKKKHLSDLNPEIKDLKEKLVTWKADRIETRARKAQLETNLTTNLRRTKQDLEAAISSVDSDSLVIDAELKAKELSDDKILVDGATLQLRRVTERGAQSSGYHKEECIEMNWGELQLPFPAAIIRLEATGSFILTARHNPGDSREDLEI